jgi:hypothetical protein
VEGRNTAALIALHAQDDSAMKTCVLVDPLALKLVERMKSTFSVREAASFLRRNYLCITIDFRYQA